MSGTEFTPIEFGTHLTPREIQLRVRAGQDPEGLAQQSGMQLDRIMAFALPILQERAHVSIRARATTVRRAAGAGTVDDIVVARLAPLGVHITDADWDARRRDDGRWHITLTYDTSEGLRVANWVFDLKGAVIAPLDDEAHWLMGEPPTPVSRTQPTVTKPTLPVFRNTEQEGVDTPSNVVAFSRHRNEPIDSADSGTPEEADPDASVTLEDADSEIVFDDINEPPPVKPSGKSKRKSIPSWDEILFGPQDS